jgi:PncC family amidohydrolase
MDGSTEMVARIGSGLLGRQMTLSVAESCTGGLIGHLLTNLPGSSEWFLGGVVAYANSIKTSLLEVGQPVIEARVPSARAAFWPWSKACAG